VTERDEFFSFEEALDRLRLKEEELKRLVSEGEIRAFREGETMKLRRADVDSLRRELMGGDVVDLDDAADEQLVLEDEFADPGMATEELSGADTLLEEEVLDLDEEELEEAELEEEESADGEKKRERRGPEPVGEPVHPLVMLGIFVTTILLVITFPLLKNGNGEHSDIAQGISGMFGKKEEAPAPAVGDAGGESEAAPADATPADAAPADAAGETPSGN
jgi:excisionase family DNA binding protein